MLAIKRALAGLSSGLWVCRVHGILATRTKLRHNGLQTFALASLSLHDKLVQYHPLQQVPRSHLKTAFYPIITYNLCKYNAF